MTKRSIIVNVEPGVAAYLTGDTYPYRHAIRNIGGVWVKDAKQWRVPDIEAARHLAEQVRLGEIPEAPRETHHHHYHNAPPPAPTKSWSGEHTPAPLPAVPAPQQNYVPPAPDQQSVAQLAAPVMALGLWTNQKFAVAGKPDVNDADVLLAITKEDGKRTLLYDFRKQGLHVWADSANLRLIEVYDAGTMTLADVMAEQLPKGAR
jgi:hypothetical protein